MKITINQNDIEEAIRNHICNSINVDEDANISIKLKAGRGENGYAAFITIGEEGEAPAKEKKPYTGAKRGRKPKVQAAQTAQVEQPKTTATITEEQPSRAAVDNGTSAVVESDEEAVFETADESVEEQLVEAQEKPKARTSLFGNLTKPVNS